MGRTDGLIGKPVTPRPLTLRQVVREDDRVSACNIEWLGGAGGPGVVALADGREGRLIVVFGPQVPAVIPLHLLYVYGFRDEGLVDLLRSNPLC